MGEKIKDLASIKIANTDFVVELNKATVNGGNRFIHLQNKDFRLCLTEKEYIMMASSLLKSQDNFKYNKKVK